LQESQSAVAATERHSLGPETPGRSGSSSPRATAGMQSWYTSQPRQESSGHWCLPRLGPWEAQWVAITQDLDVWRRVVAEGSCSCLNNEGGTPLGVMPACVSDIVSSGHGWSATAELTAADRRIPELSSHARDGVSQSGSHSSDWLVAELTSSPAAAAERRLGRKAPAQTQ